MKSPTSPESGSPEASRPAREVKAGDFTHLAGDYAKFRPDYSTTVLDAILGTVKKSRADIDAVDVGAGTGIWTRMLASRNLRSVIGIEPNREMLDQARASDPDGRIRWMAGSAEVTGLPSDSADIISMASSLHWTDFERALDEFCRVLRPGGRFVALWNPRRVESDPLLVSIEQALAEIGPGIRRVSSGKSGLTEALTDRLHARPDFEDVCYVEGDHTILMTRERYLGAWKSVNDVRVQLGEDRFREFLARVESLLGPRETLEARYTTRSWIARKKA